MPEINPDLAFVCPLCKGTGELPHIPQRKKRSDRYREIASMLKAKGYTYRGIAEKLNLSASYVHELLTKKDESK